MRQARDNLKARGGDYMFKKTIKPEETWPDALEKWVAYEAALLTQLGKLEQSWAEYQETLSNELGKMEISLKEINAMFRDVLHDQIAATKKEEK